MPCRFQGPHPRGKSRGICPGGGVSRPTPKGEVEGDQVQATAKGEVEEDQPRGGLPGPRGGGDPSPQQTATVVDGTHPTGMHSCL